MAKKYTNKNANQKKIGSTSLHQKTVKEVLLTMSRLPFCRVWANNTGMIKTEERVVRFGLKGSSDILGIYKGVFLGIEVKTGNATQSKDQKNFQRMLDTQGGVYVLCHNSNVEQIDKLVEQAYLKRFIWGN